MLYPTKSNDDLNTIILLSHTKHQHLDSKNFAFSLKSIFEVWNEYKQKIFLMKKYLLVLTLKRHKNEKIRT